jgi:diguanylate cyclase (GGDEF)-like protein
MKQMENFPLGKRGALISAGVIFIVLSIVDASTDSQLNLSPVYLAPVLLAAWYAGTAWGAYFAFAAISASVAIGIWTEHHYSRAFYFHIDLAGRMVSLLVFLWVTTIAARLRRAHDLERTRARTDFLTGIANRAAFMDVLSKEIERQRRVRHPFTLISLDCDNFKAVNDRFGHAVGDDLLRMVARTLASSVRKTDFVARLGGDEFIALLPETNLEQCGELVKHLDSRLRDAMRINRWPVTFSIGGAAFRNAPRSADEAVEFADSLMYQAKKAGKNRTVQASYPIEKTPVPPPCRMAPDDCEEQTSM